MPPPPAPSTAIPQQQPPAGQAPPLPVQLDPGKRTPVFGTAEPAHGPPEELRRRAYALPAHNPLHWLLLLAADRLAVADQLGQDARSPAGPRLLARHLGRQVRGQPKGALIVAALVGGALVGRRLKG